LDSGCSSSVLAAIDRMGVMPEPAAKPTRWMARFFLTEAAVRRHHLDGVAGLDRLGRPVGEQAASTGRMPTPARRPCQAAARAADGVAAAHVLAVDGGAQGEELAGLEGEASFVVGDGEGDRHRAGRLGADALDGEVVETES
jgi:hypothetical protein